MTGRPDLSISANIVACIEDAFPGARAERGTGNGLNTSSAAVDRDGEQVFRLGVTCEAERFSLVEDARRLLAVDDTIALLATGVCVAIWRHQQPLVAV